MYADTTTTDSAMVSVTVDNAISVGRRLDLDHQRGLLSNDEYALTGLDTVLWPASVSNPRYQSATGNDTPFWAYLSTWAELSPATKDAMRQRFEFSTSPIPAGTAVPEAGVPGDRSTAADIEGCPTTLDWVFVVTFGGDRPMCHAEIRYPDSSKDVPSLDFTFLVGGDEVEEVDRTGNSGSTTPNGVPDYLDVMADNMFASFLYYRDVLDLDVEDKFGPDHPIPVHVVQADYAWVSPVDDHVISIGTRNHSTDIARHEMAHVFQYRYLSTFEFLAEFCPSDWCQSSNLGFMEASADWAGHQVVEANPGLGSPDGYFGKLDNYLREPWRQMTIDYGPVDWHDSRAYGEFIFFEWFQEQQQVPADLMKRLYDGMREPDDRTSIEVIDDILNDAGHPFYEVLPVYWQSVYMLANAVSGDDPSVGLSRAFTDADLNDWVTHLANNNMPGGGSSARGRPGHEFLRLPLDRSEGSVNGQIEPGGAVFVELEPAAEMTGTAEVTVAVPQARAGKYQIKVLSWEGGIGKLCSDPAVADAPASGAELAPRSGADPRPKVQSQGRISQVDGDVRATPSLDGATVDVHVTVPFTSRCTSATLMLTNTDPTEYDQTDDWSVKAQIDVVGASLTNLDTRIGVSPAGELNVPGAGLGLSHRDEDAIYQECLCEGWGVADVTSGIWGGAYQARRDDGSEGTTASEGAGGAEGDLTVLDFQQNLVSITSRTGIGTPVGGQHPLEVEHVFSTASRPGGPGSTILVSNMFEVKVTITNNGSAPAHPRYRRLMDWDVPPDPFYEHVTVGALGPVPPTLLRTSNNGFSTTNPLVEPSNLGDGSVPPPSTTFFDDVGPLDHGALFDFELGELAPGASRTFVLYYGAADDEAEAMGYLTDLSAQVYSLGQTHDDPSSPEFGPTTGKPHTFIFAAKDL